MNLKERLSSTENLLRSIRSGEAFASLKRPREQKPQAAPGADSTPSPGDASASRSAPPPDPASSASPAKKPLWNRTLTFGSAAKSAVLGVSMTSGRLSLAIVANGTIQFSTRFPFGPDQAFGQKDFPAFLRTCLESVRDKAPQLRIWAVLRSQDLDLNVLTVPKLSGAKLDAAVYWTQQKEKKFAEAEYAMDYVVLGPTKDSKEPRLDVLTCLARRVDVDSLREAFREAGWPLEGITTLPSAMQALYRLPGAPGGFTLAANIHVEEDASTIGLYADGNLRFSRFIRSGTDSMAEAVLVHFQDRSKPRSRPAPQTTQQAAPQSAELELSLPGAPAAPAGEPPAPPEPPERTEPEEPPVLPPVDAAQAKGLMRHALLGGPVPKGVSPGHVLSEAQMLEAIAPAIDRLAKQVERTLEFYASSTQQRCDVVHCSGRIFRAPGVFETLAGHLGYPHLAFDATTMLPAKPGSVSDIDRMALAPALAASLSTPDKGINLLRNYKQRAAVHARQAISRGLLLGLAAALMAIAAAGFVIERQVFAQRVELAGARKQLESLGPVIDEATLAQSVALFTARQKSLGQAAARFTAPVVLAELALRAPANVKILNLTIDFGAPSAAAAAAPPTPGKPKAAAQAGDLVTLEGIAMGNKAELEPSLSRFVIELEASPLFSMPVVHQTSLKELGPEGQVLHFVLHMGVQ